MTNIFAQIKAQNKKNFDPEISSPLHQQRSSNHDLLLEQNFASENQKSELQATRIEMDTELVMREKYCRDSIQKCNQVVQIVNEKKYRTAGEIQNAIREIEKVEAKILAWKEKYMEMVQLITHTQSSQKSSHSNPTSDTRLSYNQQISRVKSSQKIYMPKQEEYSMTSPNENSTKPMVAPSSSPFGYANQIMGNSIYANSTPPNLAYQRKEDDRVAQLEKKVEELTNMIYQLVQREASEKLPIKDTKTLDQFILSERSHQ